MTQTCGVFVNQVVFLTVNHRGPLPLKEIHPTDETTVWRDLGDLEPVYDLFTIKAGFTLTEAICSTNMWRLVKVGSFFVC